MPKRSSTKKKPASRDRDENQIAADALRRLTGEDTSPAPATDAEIISKVMSAMGRKGGKKGGPARAASLSGKRRSEIAKKAAAKRWGK